MPTVQDSVPSGVRSAALQDVVARIIANNHLRATEARIGKLPERCRVAWVDREIANSNSEVQPKPSQEDR